ncbi:MAG: hypothetical protein ACI4ML_06805 [Aristaeellaceae bacterium]
MKERKYKEDYRLETRLTDRGREKRVAVYQGEWYVPGNQQDWTQARRFGLGGWVALAVCYAAYMRLSTPSAWCMYVLPVAAAGVIPALYWVMGLFALLRCPSPMIRTQREKGIGRVMRSSLGCMVLLGMAALGDVVFLAVGGQALSELPGFALLACCAAVSAGCFFRVKAAYNGMRAVPSPEGEQEPQGGQES